MSRLDGLLIMTVKVDTEKWIISILVETTGYWLLVATSYSSYS